MGTVDDLKQDLAALRIDRGQDRGGGSGRFGKWLVLVVLLAGAGAGAWLWFMRARPVVVAVATASERPAGTQAAVLNASGYVVARRRATVSAKITGKVIEVNVEEGKAVTEGQVLARLDDSTARAALGLAEAQAEAARRSVSENEVRFAQSNVLLSRLQQLHQLGLATKADLDQGQADADSNSARVILSRQQILVAERQIEVQKADLDSTIVRAPFSGVAISKDAQPGEMISPISAGGGFTRTGICTIVDMRSLEIEVDVNEAYINRVSSGQNVTAILDAYPDWRIPAHVITMVPTADRQKATVLVRIAFKQLDPRLLPDMGVKVTFLREDRDVDAEAGRPAVLVPKDAIKTDDGRSLLMVVHDGVTERRAVERGSADGDRLEVLAGLRAGEQVVVPFPAALSSGEKVVVKDESR